MIASSARWSYVLLACLLVLRVPSLVQPAGADQGLYAYVGTRILDGGLPYRDAWDQKPPAIHFVYAAMYGLWAHDSIVAATDLAIAALIAWLLIRLGRALTGTGAAGQVAAVLFLLLGDPTLSRLAGVRIRSQCETFIAAAVTAALLLALESGRRARMRDATAADGRSRAGLAAGFGVGLLLGLAASLKYNAIVYLPVGWFALWLAWGPRQFARVGIASIAGVAVPLVAMIGVFAAGGALNDLYQATIRYNLEYSAETYTGPLSSLRYLLTFPIAQARIDSIWTVGGLGCLILLGNALRRDVDRWTLLLPVMWVGAVCLSIAINGSRGLPQYFVQAVPALALAAGVAASLVWPALPVPPARRLVVRAAVLLLVAIAAWRVTDFDKIPRNALHDLAYMTGRISREEHLARYGGRAEDKYVAVSVWRLARYLGERTSTADHVYIFGFSPGTYVQANRVSASRFFWSRPVIVGFNETAPGYGARGVLDELERASPAFVVLQTHDWAPPPGDSATYFLTHPLLSAWLFANYDRVRELDDENYEVWSRRTAVGGATVR
jgi:hypothetical protein